MAHCKYSNGMYISQQPSHRNKELYVPSYLLAYCYFILLERFHLKSFLSILKILACLLHLLSGDNKISKCIVGLFEQLAR